jgi:phosphatidylethanolamine-binding protein (PEBP) family uncharacterized protein
MGLAYRFASPRAEGVSHPLLWDDVPVGTARLALIVHAIVWDI